VNEIVLVNNLKLIDKECSVIAWIRLPVQQTFRQPCADEMLC